ncbi:hypothetical protein K2X85_07330 [bacterium]|nr:hypothetical protein [bacterium]
MPGFAAARRTLPHPTTRAVLSRQSRQIERRRRMTEANHLMEWTNPRPMRAYSHTCQHESHTRAAHICAAKIVENVTRVPPDERVLGIVEEQRDDSVSKESAWGSE